MSTIELRHIITEHISHIDDLSFLNALKTIIESKVTDGIYTLSDYEKKRVDLARQDLKMGQTIEHEDLQKELNQWLNAR
jgi:hypothetical protein